MYLRVLFTGDGEVKREIDRRTGAVLAVVQVLYQTPMVERELSWRISPYQSVNVTTLTCVHEACVERLLIQLSWVCSVGWLASASEMR